MEGVDVYLQCRFMVFIPLCRGIKRIEILSAVK